MPRTEKKVTVDRATQYELNGKLHIQGIHQEFYPFMRGSMDIVLDEVDILACESVATDVVGKIDFTLYHLKDSPNGVADLGVASSFLKDENSGVVESFCDFIKVFDPHGMSDIANAVVVIENFEVQGKERYNNIGSRALRVFMAHMEFLSADFVVANPSIADIENPTYEESKWVRIYKGLGFISYAGETPIFIHSNLINLHSEGE